MDLHELSLRQAAHRLHSGDLTAEAYAEALLRRCEQGQTLNAFIELAGERLLEAAHRADRSRRAGRMLGPLHGIPLVVKDNFDVAGLPTTAGTPALAQNVPGRTAPVLQRLFDQGALLLGKTNMHELGFGVTSNNELTGAVHNPYDLAFSPGGSSGGTAAAVAARMTPAGFGADTSGSARLPAAHCGIVGYRPSTGRYPSQGIVPLSHTRDTAGLMARSVTDIELLDALLTGSDPATPRTLRGVRLGVPRDYFFADLDSQVAAATERELQRLSALGVVLVEADAPDFGSAQARISAPVIVSELPRELTRYCAEVGLDLSFEEVIAAIASPYVKSGLDKIQAAQGPAIEPLYRQVIDDVLPRHRAEYRRYLQDNDLHGIVFPTSPLLPAPVGENDTIMVDGREVTVWATLRNAVPATLLGTPGVSLPMALTEGGLPIGLEIDGWPGHDRALLAIGLAWEQQTPALPAPSL